MAERDVQRGAMSPLARRMARRAGVSWLMPALMLVVAALCGCENTRRAVPGASETELPDQEVSDFAVTETDAGRPQWKMYAGTASIYNARNTIVAKGLRIDFYNEAGKRSSSLTAREGEMHQLQRDMVARGNVVLQTEEGVRMSTEELRFINARQRIVSDAFVQVEQNGDVLTGIGFESDPNLRHYEFKRKVQATVRTRSGGILEPRGGGH